MCCCGLFLNSLRSRGSRSLSFALSGGFGSFRLRRFYIVVIIIMTAVVIVVLNISIVAANLFGLLSGLSLGRFSRRCGFGLALGGGLFFCGRLGGGGSRCCRGGAAHAFGRG